MIYHDKYLLYGCWRASLPKVYLSIADTETERFYAAADVMYASTTYVVHAEM